MTRSLSRLLRPNSITVIGGGAWCRSVTEQLIKAKYSGDIWPIHPRAEDVCGLTAYPTVMDLPSPPDAAFVGINRDATIGAIERLNRIGAGGAVCFASGFAETEDGQDTNARLLKAAKDMPILGPNCYGMINALDGAMLWPDQHGCRPVNKGVAILTQSSNIAINLTMQNRGLPIAYMVTCGNQAQLSMADIAMALLDDSRVTAIGVHIEGFSDLPAWQALARKAQAQNVHIIALKVGKSTEAQSATISHTASLAGSNTGANALLTHLGINQVNDLPTLAETLKILHVAGTLPSTRIASISCSGGEASLIADIAHDANLTFLTLTDKQTDHLFAALGPKVALANPLDYHTYIWRDVDAMTRTFSALIDSNIAITFLIVDFPRSDTCDASDWDCVIKAATQTKTATGGTVAMVSTLPELMPEHVALQLIADGIIPLNGLHEALSATQAAQFLPIQQADIIVPAAEKNTIIIPEADAKTALKSVGLDTPNTWTGDLKYLTTIAQNNTGPYVLKSTGSAHKSETGGVALSLIDADAVLTAGQKMPGDRFLLEEMITSPVAELLVGVVSDPAHGFILTLGAGGIYTELHRDTISTLIPATRNQLKQCLTQLKMAPILSGYRNQPAANIDSIIDAIQSIQNYVLANLDTVQEVEINPLIATQTRAMAVDALIRKRHD